MDKHDLLCAEKVASILSYDPDNGEFRWLRTGNRAMRSGDRAGSIHPRGYVHIKIGGYSYAAHRLAWLLVYGAWPAKDLDHKNGVRRDNRIANLRECAGPVENNQNVRRYASNKSGAHGVGWHKASGKWRARISVGGKQHNLGVFASAEDAAEAYRAAKSRLHTFQPEQRDA